MAGIRRRCSRRADWGIYRRAHRVGAAHARGVSNCGSVAIWCSMRSRDISLLRAMLRQEGWRLPVGQAEAIDRRLENLALPRGAARDRWRRCGPGCGELNRVTARGGCGRGRRRRRRDPVAQR